MLKKFDMESVRTATTPYEDSKPKSKDEPDDAVNVHLYRSMIGSLMYLTASRPDIQFAVSACSRHQVTPLTSNLNAVKKIFKYLKGQPKLGLWYPRDSPFVLEAYSDSDYAGSHGDRKSTTGGCQFLGRRLISWQCKKQTIVATSSTEAEYVAAANCCGQGSHISSEEASSILATIDRDSSITITESYIRSQLQLDDDGGGGRGGVEDIVAHTEADIYLRSTKQYHVFKFTCKMFANTRLNFQETIPLLTTMLPPAQAAIAGPIHGLGGGGGQMRKMKQWEVLIQTSPPRATQAPPEVNTQESELNAHKLLFKEVVEKLIKKVKLLEDKLKGRKRKFVLTDSDKEEDAEQDVDPLIKLAKAAATAVPTGGSHEADIPPSSSVPTDEFAGGSDVPAGATTGPSADPSNKGKSPLVEEDPPVRERTFRQREEDRLGEEAARRMYEEEQAELEREREEMQKKRQQDVLNSAKYYTDSDWTDIMGQVHANQGLTADLLGPDVTEDNFAERMVALIAKRRREFVVQRFKDKLNKPMTYAQQKAFMRTFVKNQSSTIYTTGWTMKHVKSFSDDQLKTEFDKIRTAAAALQSQNIRRSLKRPGADLEQASSKKSKSTEAPKSDVPADSQQPSVEVPSQKLHRGAEVPVKHLHCLYNSTHWFLIQEEMEVIAYGVRLDQCHLQERQLSQDKKAAGIGLVLWGDLKVLMDSPKVNDGSNVWKNQQTWSIQSWKLYSYSGVHVLETVGGLVVHMFVDKRYPLSVNLIERMLDHQLEICQETVGNELTTAVQLIAFLKKQIADSRRPKVYDCPQLDANCLVADSKFMKVAFGVDFKILLFNPLVFSTKDLSRNLKLTVSNSSLGEDC
ncbi:hypothetical protein Tco_1079625 [Tanacetum coccineum]|uniref:Uncharacterized protein n=1 Tax=Tanacetum coccineum TaxID=301880 RepID=A0ABQ5HTW6_9ASTR